MSVAKWLIHVGIFLALAIPAALGQVTSTMREGILSALPDESISKTDTYIVQMAQQPVVAYEGGIKGLRGTKPGKNKKLNPNDPAVIAYADYLLTQQDEALKRVGGGRKVHSYKYVFNGFAAKLTGKQRKALSEMPGVLSISSDALLRPSTITTTEMLNLNQGVWNSLGGVENAGEDIIIGIIDTGIWPESQSFSDRTRTNGNGRGNGNDDKLSYRQIPGWHGRCVPGESFPASDCNQKIIGAQWFNQGFGGDEAILNAFPFEFISARDADGHGTHMASTAAGNAAVPVSIGEYDLGEASGMAPRARLAIYKVCWGDAGPLGYQSVNGTQSGCFTSDSVAAIDQAVIDGVDVLNFSISGSRESSLFSVYISFLYAADAGVFVAASAGNSGRASSVNHNVPWMTTVAASTNDRDWVGDVILGDGRSFEGKTVSRGVEGELIYSGDAAADDDTLEQAQLCFPGTLDSNRIAGKVVLCDRGDTALIVKSYAVAQAGGIGMILANLEDSGQSISADFHFVPSIHVDPASGAAIRAYAQSGEAHAEITAGEQLIVEAPEVANFSSRGPALAGKGDLLKPDILAPGVDIIAAVSPYSAKGENFGAYSGTSMSSPHIAGVAALLKQRHPDWSPAEIKSALMTSATTNTNQGIPIIGGALDYGAGFVQPNAADNPGLVYDADLNDWFLYLCGTGELPDGVCPSAGIDPSDLNYPSIAIGALTAQQRVVRRVTNAGDSEATFTATVEAPPGIDTVLDPTTLTLPPGGEADYSITFTPAENAAIGSFSEGSITWFNADTSARSPIVVRPVILDAPGEITEVGETGTAEFDVAFGASGDFGTVFSGMSAAETYEGRVLDDPTNNLGAALRSEDRVGLDFKLVTIPPGTRYQRIALFDEYTSGVDDLELLVLKFVGEDLALVDLSFNDTSAEHVDIVNPQSDGGSFLVIIHGFDTEGPDTDYTLFSFSLIGDQGNTSILTPPDAVLGASNTVSVTWEGLESDTKSMGMIEYTIDGSPVGRTLLRIDTD